jgi:hypothetical protein
MRVELRAILKNADERVLREIGGVILVLQATDEVIEQLWSVTRHEIVERRAVTCGKLGHVRLVAFVKLCGVLAHGLTFRGKLTLPLPRGPS